MFFTCIIHKNVVSTYKMVNPEYEFKNLNKKRIQSAKKKQTEKDYSRLMAHCLIEKKVFKCLNTENILWIVWYNQK